MNNSVSNFPCFGFVICFRTLYHTGMLRAGTVHMGNGAMQRCCLGALQAITSHLSCQKSFYSLIVLCMTFHLEYEFALNSSALK